MRTLLFGVMCLVSACHGCDGEGGPAGDAGPDAQVDASPPSVLGFRDNTVKETLFSGLKLTSDEKTLVYCDAHNRVGFIEVASLGVTKSIDVTDRLPSESYCRLTIIDDFAYAHYAFASRLDDPDGIVKISLATKEVVAIWNVPDKYAPRTYDEYDGVVATSSPGVGLLTNEDVDDLEGIRLVYVNLETGALTEKLLSGTPANKYLALYASLGNDRFLGELSFPSPSDQGFHFIVDAQRPADLVKLQYDDFSVSFAHHPETERVIIAGLPSAGWDILSTKDGRLLKHFPYINSGFSPKMHWVSADRVAHVASGSSNAYVTVMDTRDGHPLAIASLPRGASAVDSVLSQDRRRLYVGGLNYLAEVAIPEDL